MHSFVLLMYSMPALSKKKKTVHMQQQQQLQKNAKIGFPPPNRYLP
jgi:hypothetical protein